MQKYHHLQEILQSRRSIFPNQFNGEAITEKDMETIFEAAKFAPTHKLTQPWRFTAYMKKDFGHFVESLSAAMQKQLMTDIPQKLSKITDKLEKSQAAVLIGTHFDATSNLPEWEEIAATAMAVQNIWLTAVSMGIGTYWSSPGFLVNSGIDMGYPAITQCMGIMYFGRFNMQEERGMSERKSLQEYFHIRKSD